jgi:riboflavin synthase
MFTGLIETTGSVRSLESRGGGTRLEISVGWNDLSLGESIAVNGACLTAARLSAGGFSADLSRETMSRTTLGSIKAGSRINLERALRAGDRLGGHLLSGHVDCLSRVMKIIGRLAGSEIKIWLPPGYSQYIVSQGSVAVDGVSLTVSRREGDGFWVSVIPHTLALTNLGERRSGDPVNLEFDMIAKYAESILRKGRT